MKNLVEPIKDKKDVEAVEQYLAKHSLRNQLIWVFGCNTGLRISDILGLNVEDVRNYPHIYNTFPFFADLSVISTKTVNGFYDQ